MEQKEYIKVKIEKPKTPLSDSRRVLRTNNDDFWKGWIFYFLLSFYQKFNREELKQKIEYEKKKNKPRIEKIITDFLRQYLEKDEEFKGICEFLIDQETLIKGKKEGYYDVKIQHSQWQNKDFCFECKNLNETQDSINKYVYHHEGKQIYDGGVYRYFNDKYAQNQDFGGMIGFVLEGNYLNIKTKIHEKLKEKFDISPEGDLIKINNNKNNDFTFDSYHNRKKKEFVIHHLLFNVCP